MTAIQTYLDFYGINVKSLNRVETFFVENILFDEISNRLIQFIKNSYQIYMRLIHVSADKENAMIEGEFIRFIITDIINSGDYTLEGIAHYTDVPEEIIYELAVGKNFNPSLLLTKKLLALHRSIKPDFYRELLGKLAENYEQAA